MTTRLVASFALAFMIPGCGPTPATRGGQLSDSEPLIKLIETELAAAFPGTTYEFQSGSGKNIRSQNSVFRVPSATFNGDDLRKAAKAAVLAWGEMDTYPIRGGPRGSGNHCELDFGNRESHVFVDLVGYPNDSGTDILCLVRCVE